MRNLLMRKVCCSECGAQFQRYAANAKRAAKPQYCKPECFSLSMEKRANAALKSRLLAKVAAGDQKDCWEWQGRRDPHGYGRLDYRMPGSRRARPKLVHRLIYQEFIGPIPDGMHVCHTCDNPPCCNPDHYFIGTMADNNADMDRKGRRRWGAVRGEQVGTSKLTEPQALEILTSPESSPALASRFGVTREAISLIRRRINWSHLSMPE